MADELTPNDFSSLWGSPPKKDVEAAGPRVEPQAPNIGPVPIPETATPLEPRKEVRTAPVERPVTPPEPEEIAPPPPAASSSPVIDMEETPIDEKDLGASRLDGLLGELGLSRKHLVMFALLIIAVIVGIFFGIKFLFGFLEGRGGEEEEVVEEKVVEEIKEETAQDEKKEKDEKKVEPRVSLRPSSLHPSLRTAFTLSLPVLLPSTFFPRTGIEAAFFLGQGEVSRKDLVSESIFLLKRMQNAFSADVNQLLLTSLDRRAALRNHLTLLRHLAEQAEVTVTQLESEITRLSPELKAKTAEREQNEKNFFSNLNALQPQASQDLLAFMAVSQEYNTVRAELQAYTEILNRYRKAIPRLKARTTDIELNEEPLVKGIKVYDVKGSDLELILPVDVGVPEQKSSGAAGVSGSAGGAGGAGSGFQVSPSRTPLDAIAHPLLREPQDFISAPGGGMR